MTEQDDTGDGIDADADAEVEALVGRSLDEHAEQLGATDDPGMGVVLDRVKVRQRRRRQLVAVGTVVGVTALGTALLSLLPDGPTDTIASGDATVDDSDDDDLATEATTFATAPPTAPAPATTPATTPADAEPVTTAATTVPPAARVSEAEQSYIVLVGDSMFAIADKHGIEADELALYNEWSDGIDHLLLPGDTIRIPPDSLIPESGTTVPAPIDPTDSCLYTIVAGDFPLQLAERFGITVDDLVAANSASVMNSFLPGAQLVIPGVTDCG